MIIKLPDILVEVLAVKYLILKPAMTYEQYVQVYIRESKIGVSENYNGREHEGDWR